MNGYEYSQNPIMFDERLNQEIAKIKKEFKNGNIKTQTDYAYALKNVVNEFYKNLGKPSFEFIEAATIPSYGAFSSMIEKAKADMEVIMTGSNENYINLEASKSKTDDAINMLINRLTNIITTAEALEDKINAIRKASDVVYADDFSENNNTSNYYKDGLLTYTDVSTGSLMLGVTKNKSSANNNVNIEILNSSNGFPGDTHEIYNSIGTVNNNIKYKGENNPHIDLNLIKTVHGDTIKDSNDWFEFEMFNISDSLKESTSMIGFNYKEGISWITDDEELKLNLKLELDTEARSNYIVFKGTPKTNANVSNPIIHKVIISDSNTLVQSVQINKELVGTVIVPFNAQNVKTVEVYFKQSEYLDVKVCRQYGINIDPTNISKYIDDDYKGFIEVDYPTQSIELLGLKYDSSNKSIIYPNTKTTTTFIDNEYTKSQLFYNTQAKNNYELKQQAVSAKKYVIGVQEIDLRYRKYVNSGCYISKTFTADGTIKQITLNSDDYIPESFNNYLKDNEDQTKFIKYYISFDEGAEWHSIYPRSKAHLGPCTIILNSNVAVLNRNENVIYIDTLSDSVNFKIKIELTKPNEIDDETPIVYGYNIDMSTKEDME